MSRLPSKKELAADPKVFFEALLLPHLRGATEAAPFHKELFAILPAHHRVIIAAPRAHAKSTICSFAYPIWSTVTGFKKEIIIVSKTAALAESWLTKIKDELTSNEELIKIFGKQKGKLWRKNYLELKNGSLIHAKGCGFQIRGYRPDALVLDDLEDEESVRSVAQTGNLEQWFMASLLNVLDKGEDNQLIMIGNYIGPGCLLKRLVDRVETKELPWKAFVFSAQPDTPLWPEKWDRKALEERRQEIGTRQFSSEFENNPLPEGMTMFQEQWFKYYDNLPDKVIYFMSVDTADTLRHSGDYSVIMIGAVDSNNNMYVVDYVRKRFTPEAFWNTLFELHSRYDPFKTAVEAQAFKNHFKYSAKQEMERRDHWFTIKMLPVSGDKKRRALPVAAKMERGKVHLKVEQSVLRSELLHYPYGTGQIHDDTVAALIYFDAIATKFTSRESEARRDVPENSPMGQLKKAMKPISKDVIFA